MSESLCVMTKDHQLSLPETEAVTGQDGTSCFTDSTFVLTFFWNFFRFSKIIWFFKLFPYGTKVPF